MAFVAEDEGLARLLELLEVRESQYRAAEIQCMLHRDGNKLRPYFIKITALEHAVPTPTELRYEYPRAVLIQSAIKIDALKAALLSLSREKKFLLNDLPIELDQNRSSSLDIGDITPSDDKIFSVGWSYQAFSLSLTSQGYFPGGALIQPGLPAFPSGMYAARTLFGVDLIRNSGRQGSMNIVIPHYGARIEAFTLKRRPWRFSMNVHTGTSALKDLEIKGWYSTGDRDYSFGIPNLSESNQHRIPEAPRDFSIWLLNRATGEVVDLRSNMLGRPTVFSVEPESGEELGSLLKNGEGETVEFKQEAMDKPNSPFDSRDIAKEIVAFSNHEGGVILLGVSDEGDVKGVSDCRKLSDWIANVAGTNCQPAVRVRFETHKIAGKEICAVYVPKGLPGIPYQRNDGRIYVRRAATSRLADPYEVQALARPAEVSNSLESGWQ